MSPAGCLTLVGAPLIGRLADRFGKLPVYRVVATIAATLMVAGHDPRRCPLVVAVGVAGALMLCNAGRMVAGLAIVTGSVEPAGGAGSSAPIRPSSTWPRAWARPLAARSSSRPPTGRSSISAGWE